MYYGSFKPLSEAGVRKIHEATLHILEEVGIEVHNDRALPIFARGGAVVDADSCRVRLPRRMVEELVRKAPGTVRLCGRRGSPDVVIGGGRAYHSGAGTASNVVDFETGELRNPKVQDIQDAARLSDTLKYLDVFSLPAVPMDVPEEQAQIQRYYTGMKNTTKPITGSVITADEASAVVRMARIIAGGEAELRERPFIAVVACTAISPLVIDDQATSVFMRFVEEGLPAVVPVGPTAGMTTPITLAGTLLVQNAECLSMVVLGQLINPSAAVMYTVFPAVSDPRTMAYASGPAEAGLLCAGAAQLAAFYDLPSVAYVGMTDANVSDVQAAYEKSSGYHLAVAAGADLIANCGMLQSLSAIALEQYVIDSEIFGGIVRAMRGIEVTDETLALETIAEVGPGGHFITTDHTLAFMRKEFQLSDLSSRLRWDEWTEEGRPEARARARRIVTNVLSSPLVSAIPAEADEQIRREFPWLVP